MPDIVPGNLRKNGIRSKKERNDGDFVNVQIVREKSHRKKMPPIQQTRRGHLGEETNKLLQTLKQYGVVQGPGESNTWKGRNRDQRRGNTNNHSDRIIRTHGTLSKNKQNERRGLSILKNRLEFRNKEGRDH